MRGRGQVEDRCKAEDRLQCNAEHSFQAEGRQRIGSKPAHCAACNAEHHLLCLCNATAPAAPQWVPQWQAGWLLCTAVTMRMAQDNYLQDKYPHASHSMPLVPLVPLLYASHHVSSVYAALCLIDDDQLHLEESGCNLMNQDATLARAMRATRLSSGSSSTSFDTHCCTHIPLRTPTPTCTHTRTSTRAHVEKTHISHRSDRSIEK